jgi:hypothetical protein
MKSKQSIGIIAGLTQLMTNDDIFNKMNMDGGIGVAPDLQFIILTDEKYEEYKDCKHIVYKQTVVCTLDMEHGVVIDDIVVIPITKVEYPKTFTPEEIAKYITEIYTGSDKIYICKELEIIKGTELVEYARPRH